MTDASQGSFAAIVSALAVAGLGETSILDALPKGALVLICSALLVIVWAFVKRDAARYKDRFDTLEALAEKHVTQAQFSALADIVREIDHRQTIIETKIGIHG